MADTVLKKNNDDFTNLAKQHRTIADHTRQMLSGSKVLQDTMIASIQSSSMSDVLPHYIGWWEQFHDRVLEYADLQDQIANNLEKTPPNFDGTDDKIKQSFSDDAKGFSS